MTEQHSATGAEPEQPMVGPMWAPDWVDLATPDTQRVRPFYEGLFGWVATEYPTDTGVPYTEFSKDGKSVAGMMPQPPEERGTPSAWLTMVFVPDVDEVTDRVAAAGGMVLAPVFDVMTQGRMSVAADPSGAVVGIWQPGEHRGAELFNKPGALTWNELQSRSLPTALPFYEQVFGWRWVADGTSDMGYQVAHRDDKPGADTSVAGAMPMPPGVPPDVPSHWQVYFAVEDCDAAASRATELGGSVVVPPMAMGPGRFAGLLDPCGAMLMVGTFPDM